MNSLNSTNPKAVCAKLLSNLIFALAVVMFLGGAQSAMAANNTADNVINSHTDLTAPASYSGGLPGTTSDVTFTANTYSPATFTLGSTSTSLSIGTLDDLSSTALTIQNATGTLDTLTLNGGTNSVAPNPSDLLYVAAGGLTISNNGAVTGSNGLSLVLASSGNFDINATSSIGVVISGSGGFAKTGSAALTLSAANTYMGTTTVDGGTLTLSGTIGSGSNNLAVGGGTFTFSKTAPSTQTFANTAINQGASTISTVASDTLALGALTESAGGVADFGTTGTITVTSPTSGTITNGIIGGWATTGGLANFATVNGSGAIVAYSGYTNDTWASGNNTTVTKADSITAGSTTNSLYFNAAAGSTVTLAGTTASPDVITSGGILVTPSVTTTAPTITGGVLESSGNAFYISTGTSSKGLTIASAIADYGSGHTSVTYDVPAGATISGNNTYSGATYVDNTGANNLTLSGSTNTLGTGTLYLGSDGSANTVNISTSTTATLGNTGITVANGTGTRKLLTSSNNSIIYTNGNISLDTGATLTLEPKNTGIILGLPSGTPTETPGFVAGNGIITGTGTISIIDGGGTNATGQYVAFDDQVNNTGGISIVGSLVSTQPMTVNFNNTIGSNVTSISEAASTAAETVTLSAVNSFNGLISIGAGATFTVAGAGSLGNNGTVSVSNNVYTISGGTINNDTGAIADAGTFTYASSATQTLSGALSGAGVFSDTGTGVLTLTGANTFTGNTTIGTGSTTGAVLEFGNTQSLYITPTATNLIVYSGNTLALGVGGTGFFNSTNVSSFISAAAAISSNTGGFENGSNIGIDTTNAGGSFTYGTAINNFGTSTGNGLTKLGTGTLILTATNGYTGTTTISAGTLQLGTGVSGSDGSILSTSGIVDNGALVFDLFGAASYSAAITGASGTVLQEGTGVVTLGGTSTFAGGLTIDTTVKTATVNGTGAQPLGEGTISLAGTNSTTGVLNYTGSTGSLGDAITVPTGDQGTINNAGTGRLTLSGPISKNGSVLYLTGTSSGSFNVTGHITGAMSGSDLDVVGTTVELSNTNTYNGPTSIYGPSTSGYDVLEAGIAAALPTATVVTLGNSAAETPSDSGYANILDLNSFAQTIAGLASSNDANDSNYVVNGNTDYVSSGAAAGTFTTLTIAPAASTSYTFAGVVGGAGGSSNFGVKINGSSTGTEIFTGANTYTGPTTVSSGNLYINNATGSGTGFGTSSSGGGVSVSGSTSVLAGGGYIQPASGATSGVTVSSGGSIFSGSNDVSGPVAGSSSKSYSTSSTAVVGGTGYGLTLDNTSAKLGTLTSNSILSVSGGKLSFALGTGSNSNGSSPLSFATPNMNSSYMNVIGDTAGEISFTGTDTVTIQDMTNYGLTTTLGLKTPYLLIQTLASNGGSATGDDSTFYGLVTSTGPNGTGTLSLDGNGYVVGVWDGTPNPSNPTQAQLLADNTPITIDQVGSNGQALPLGESYTNAQLVLWNGDLEVVPEPGTWALMLGGLAVLVFWQRRKGKQS